MNVYNPPPVPVADVPFGHRGETYWDAVRNRGGHEYTSGAVEWEPTDRTCPGCRLCESNVVPLLTKAGGRHAAAD